MKKTNGSMENRTTLDIEKHVAFVLGLEQKSKNPDALYFIDYKRITGVFWAMASLSLLKRLDALPSDRIIRYVLECYHPEKGAFSGNTDQDTHLLYTLSGVQILALYDELERVDCDAIAKTISKLQQTDGSFAGDKWGEIDTRFSYCGLLTLSIIGRLDAIDVELAVEFILKCQNFDGGFGCIPNAESHAGQVFCCVGALALVGALDRLDKASWERLGFWLCERQLPCGGFNGRPDKSEDVCYSWWVLASLSMLNQVKFIDGERLSTFISQCQDDIEGGFANRPGDMSDMFHTFFGLGALSLLGDDRLDQIDPMYALPVGVVRRLHNRNRKSEGNAGDRS